MELIKKYGMNFIIYIFLMIILVITIFPILYTFFASFKSNQEILTAGTNIIPKKFTFENYKQAWLLADFKRYTFNSIYMTASIVIGTIITSSMAGYAFSRGEFKGKKIIFAAFTATMFVSLGSITLYPLVEIAKFLHINTNLWGVIIIKVFGLNIMNIYLVRSFLDTVPREIDEAATIDGCNFFRIYYEIILPLIKPIIATIGLITFRDAWNDYLMPLVFTLSNPQQSPLIVGVVSLRSSGAAASSWNLMLAGTMLSIVPMLTIYLSLNRYFVQGLTSGAVKG